MKITIFLIIFLSLSISCIPAIAFGEPAEKADVDNITRLDNPIGETNVNKIIGRVIGGAASIMGAFVLFMFFWGGYTWLISAGNPEKVKKGAQTMIWAAIGAAVVLLSYIVLKNVFEFLGGIK